MTIDDKLSQLFDKLYVCNKTELAGEDMMYHINAIVASPYSKQQLRLFSNEEMERMKYEGRRLKKYS